MKKVGLSSCAGSAKLKLGVYSGTFLETIGVPHLRDCMTQRFSFRSFKTGPETIRLAVMLYTRFLLSLRNVEDLLHERHIDISHETVRYW